MPLPCMMMKNVTPAHRSYFRGGGGRRDAYANLIASPSPIHAPQHEVRSRSTPVCRGQRSDAGQGSPCGRAASARILLE